MTRASTEEAIERLPRIDVEFPVTGGPVLLDHGYPLFAALSRALGDLHGAEWLAIHPLRGTSLGAGKLALRRDGPALTLRIPHDRLPDVLRLSGRTLEVAGARLQVGAPQLRMLRPAGSLVARAVTFKHHLTPETFLPHVIEELARMGARAAVTLGRRRVLTVAGDKIVGFGLSLHDLSAQDSLRLQSEGLGGRRRFGCGVLVPVPRGRPPMGSQKEGAP